MTMVGPVVKEIYDKSEILEEWHDTHKFKFRRCEWADIYYTHNTDHLCRSKVMYHDAFLEQKVKAIEVGFEIMLKDR